MNILQLRDYGFHGVIDLDKVVYVSGVEGLDFNKLSSGFIMASSHRQPTEDFYPCFTYQLSDENGTREFKSESMGQIQRLHNEFARNCSGYTSNLKSLRRS